MVGFFVIGGSAASRLESLMCLQAPGVASESAYKALYRGKSPGGLVVGPQKCFRGAPSPFLGVVVIHGG